MRVHLILIDGDGFPLAHQRSIVLVLGWPVQIKREIATLKLLKHPNVVRLYEVKLHRIFLCPLQILLHFLSH